MAVRGIKHDSGITLASLAREIEMKKKREHAEKAAAEIIAIEKEYAPEMHREHQSAHDKKFPVKIRKTPASKRKPVKSKILIKTHPKALKRKLIAHKHSSHALAPKNMQHFHRAYSAPKTDRKDEFVKTGIKGFDELFEKGIPKTNTVLLSGGAGSGKTLMGLNIVANMARQGKKCLFMSFEESEERIRQHMKDFGWTPEELEKKGLLRIQRFSIFDISRVLEAMMEKSQGDLLIDVKPVILPHNFKPDIVVIDSLTAIASAFAGRESYRSYIENLFRYLESLNVTSFLVTETTQVPTIFSTTGVEEFLADGVIVLYNLRKGDVRQSALEVLKMRGASHTKKIIAMQIVSGKGVEVYPEQEVFEGIT